jgi:probable rRNA maturation factor
VTVTVDVQFGCSPRGRPDRRRIARWVRAAVAGRRSVASVTVRVVGRREGAELNYRWRRRNGPTNVLSFPADGVDHAVPGLLGDIVICAPVVETEAREQGKTRDAHWAHMVVHGVLHLLGLDHVRKSEARRMEAEEKRILAELGYPDPYA